MKVRIIRKTEYTVLHHVQVKTRWWPFWRTVARGDLLVCKEAMHNLLTHGKPVSIIAQGESK